MLRISASLQHRLVMTHVPDDVVRPAIPPPTITISSTFSMIFWLFFLKKGNLVMSFFPPRWENSTRIQRGRMDLKILVVDL